MANTNNPRGFQPLMRSITGGPGEATVGGHKIVGVATALFIGDAVQLNGSGTKVTDSIAVAGAATAIRGVNLIYGAAATATDHLFIAADKQLFAAQIDTITVAQLQMNAALVATAGDVASMISRQSLNGVAVTAALNCKLLGLYQTPDNAVGAFAKVVVLFNKSQYADQTAGV